MIHDEEFDLAWAEGPPGWVQAVGPMMELWGNPVFQRRYLLWRLKPAFGVRASFLTGLVASLILNIFFMLVTDKESALLYGFGVSFAAPAIIVMAFMSTRLYASCLVGTPLELRRELSTGMLGTILTTPISDSKIFVAECVSGMMRGLGAVEEVLAILAGLLIPYVLLHISQLWGLARGVGIEIFWWLVLLVMVLMIVGLLNIMTTFAAGLYAILLPVVATMGAVVIHVWGLFLGSLYLAWEILIVLANDTRALEHANLLVVLLAIALYEIAVLTMLTMLTAHAGVLAFAVARRPGYFEPERANAAGLLLRERDTGVRFGQEI